MPCKENVKLTPWTLRRVMLRFFWMHCSFHHGHEMLCGIEFLFECDWEQIQINAIYMSSLEDGWQWVRTPFSAASKIHHPLSKAYLERYSVLASVRFRGSAMCCRRFQQKPHWGCFLWVLKTVHSKFIAALSTVSLKRLCKVANLKMRNTLRCCRFCVGGA